MIVAGKGEPKFDELDADEKDVCVFLASCGEQFASRMEIARRAGGKKKFQEDPKWANEVLTRLTEKRMVELNSTGHYRLCSESGEEQKVAPKKKQEPEPWNCRGKKILFVDDDADWRAVVAAFVEESGGEFLIAKDTSDAMVQTAGIKVDLVILDLNLGGESGLDLMKFLKKYHPDAPVILFTGQSLKDDSVLAMLMQGALRYVRKGPIEELRQTVETALQE